MPNFHETIMGKAFYEGTMKKIARSAEKLEGIELALGSIATSLAIIAETQKKNNEVLDAINEQLKYMR